MSDTKPWYPNLDKSKEFQDHPNPALGEDKPLEIPDAEEDTAPLQGSKDLSDHDSLEDVIASTFDPDTELDSDAEVESDATTATGKPTLPSDTIRR